VTTTVTVEPGGTSIVTVAETGGAGVGDRSWLARLAETQGFGRSGRM
jgi:hypothetical protein